MKAREHEVLLIAVEAGVASGFRRAYKHREEPEPDQAVRDVIEQEVMNAIYEWFEVGDE